MQRFDACVFDAYGTLFDVNAAARVVAGHPGREEFAQVWPQVAQDWRAKTLQYTWLRTITGAYVDFWQLTEDALDWALEAAGQSDPELRAQLLGLFHTLQAYDEVPEVLRAVQDGGMKAAILSNGTPAMLEAAVASAGIGPYLSALISVDNLRIFKPSSAVYDLVGQTLGVDRDRVLFVSSNGWDVAGAAPYGFTTLWVNRSGDPVDRLPGQPDWTGADLRVIPEMIFS